MTIFSSLAARLHSVLDLGCGTGLLARTLAMQGHQVVGVEPAKAMLEIAKAHDPQHR